jgi:PilZ domain-containing protein
MDSLDSKRISPRYAYEARFRISVQRNGKERVFEGRARDISESGMGAFVGQPLHLDEIAMITLPVPGLENASLRAQVSRAVGTEYGFQFLTLSPLQRSCIQILVENRTPIPAEK